LVFITEQKSVYSAVRTGPLNKAVCASSFAQVLKTCESSAITSSFPQEGVIAADPHVSRICGKIMPHTKLILAWLMWRESHKLKGGILGQFFNILKTHICQICSDLKVKFPPQRWTQLI